MTRPFQLADLGDIVPVGETAIAPDGTPVVFGIGHRLLLAVIA